MNDPNTIYKQQIRESETEKVPRNKMKVFVLFTFAVLGCSLAGARIVSKCELRDKLKEMFESLPTMRDTGMEKGRFLAKGS